MPFSVRINNWKKRECGYSMSILKSISNKGFKKIAVQQICTSKFGAGVSSKRNIIIWELWNKD